MEKIAIAAIQAPSRPEMESSADALKCMRKGTKTDPYTKQIFRNDDRDGLNHISDIIGETGNRIIGITGRNNASWFVKNLPS